MRTFTFRGLHVVGAAASLLLLALGACSTPAPPVRKAAQGSFESPEAAIRALGETAGSGSRTEIVRLFGPDGIDLLFSGDEVADREDALAVRAMIAQRVAFEPGENGSQVALLGNDAWPLPVPLVQGPDGWRFDIAAGREELENRRVGRNELVTIEALHAFVDAQREYASEPHDGQPRCYAQHVFSSPDKHDGLYWPTAEGEPDSPLGVLIADATEGGYEQGAEAFHGYIYRILTSRMPSAFWHKHAWHHARPLDAAAMAEAAAVLVGEHDCVAFMAADGDPVLSTVRRIFTSEIECTGDFLLYRIEATAFLKHMVRNIVGTLVEIGRGERPASDMAAVIASRDRARAGQMAPPHGLTLVGVRY